MQIKVMMEHFGISSALPCDSICPVWILNFRQMSMHPPQDFLKTKGGKWNGGLKSWLFPGSKKASYQVMHSHAIKLQSTFSIVPVVQ